jgi:FolB domain-containing protein
MELSQVDYIEIKNLAVKISIGANDWEKHLTQKIRLDLKIYLPLNLCQEELHNTICYNQISLSIRELFATGHYKLLETVAEKTTEYCLQNYRMHAIEVVAKKYHMLPDCEYVAIKLLRFAK